MFAEGCFNRSAEDKRSALTVEVRGLQTNSATCFAEHEARPRSILFWYPRDDAFYNDNNVSFLAKLLYRVRPSLYLFRHVFAETSEFFFYYSSTFNLYKIKNRSTFCRFEGGPRDRIAHFHFPFFLRNGTFFSTVFSQVPSSIRRFIFRKMRIHIMFLLFFPFFSGWNGNFAALRSAR